MSNVDANVPPHAESILATQAYATPHSSYNSQESDRVPWTGQSVQMPNTKSLVIGVPYESHDSHTTPPASATRKRASGALLASDPITLQLLFQTALGDSEQYEVISFEELEDLKREDLLLHSRITATRQKLALETKVRDAARSLNRLYASSPPATPRLGGKRSSGDKPRGKRDTVYRAETELGASTRRCEDLAKELHALEQRQRHIQMLLLRHTAGVLQMAHHIHEQHHSFLNPSSSVNGQASTPSVYEDSGVRHLNDHHDVLYGGPEQIDGILDDIREDRPFAPIATRANRGNAQQLEIVASVNSKLHQLTSRMREMARSTGSIVLTPDEGSVSSDHMSIELSLDNQLNQLTHDMELMHQDRLNAEQAYQTLESHYLAMQDDLASHRQAANKMTVLKADHIKVQAKLDDALKNATALETSILETESSNVQHFRALNVAINEIIESESAKQEMAPIPAEDDGCAAHLEYTQQRLGDLKRVIHESAAAVEASRIASLSEQVRNEECDAVLRGLWQIILAEDEDERQSERQKHSEVGTAAEIEHLSGDDAIYSLPAFSQRVQRILGQSHALRSEQSELRAKIDRHQELLTRSIDPETDSVYQQMKTDLERATKLHISAEQVLQDQERQLADRDEFLRKLQADNDSALTDVHEHHESAMSDLRSQMEASLVQSEALKQQAQQLDNARSVAENKHTEANAALEKARSTSAQLEAEVVRLTTELTIARADLDAAYGSRQERALEVQSEAQARLDEVVNKHKAAEAELSALRSEKEITAAQALEQTRRVEALQAELRSTMAEFEELTRASVEAEKEREDAEALVDKLRLQIEGLEARLCEDRLDQVGSPMLGVNAGSGLGMGTTVLRNEFKKMMRDARAEHLRVLRTEQEEKRRLEAQLRSLRKGLGPLTPSMSSNRSIMS